jgi:hypothetical protein
VSAQALTYPHLSCLSRGHLLVLQCSSSIYLIIAKSLISLALEPCPESGQSKAKPDESRI